MSKPVILTGLRANNDLHIGNYLGALLPLVDMAREKSGEYEVNLFVPDLHSFTTPIDHSGLQAAIRQNLRVFVDQASMLYLDGAEVDYVETLEGSGFKFSNPQVKSTCGCGSSFSA